MLIDWDKRTLQKVRQAYERGLESGRSEGLMDCHRLESEIERLNIKIDILKGALEMTASKKELA